MKKLSVKEKSLKEFKRNVKRKCYRKAADVLRKHRVKNVTISKSRVKKQYKLKESDLKKLNCIEVDNPYYKCAPNMKLYMIQEIEDKFGKAALREKKIVELLTN